MITKHLISKFWNSSKLRKLRNQRTNQFVGVVEEQPSSKERLLGIRIGRRQQVLEARKERNAEMVEDHRLQLIERAHILLGCQNEDRVAGERAADRQVKRLVSQFGTVDLPGLAEMLQRREKV